mmetsp:Transcript_28173/g.58724  ORF Transcript_28173/g.58724 Transcript_28173/m.58724 type:complete len:368 (+) Transcript_28173:510-1613(+)
MPPPIFFANSAAAILIPSPPNDVRSADRMLRLEIDNTKARTAPSNVPNEAMTKDPRREPHCWSAVPRRLVPRRSSGVARVREMDWRKVLAVEPPGGNTVLHVNDDDDGDDNGDNGVWNAHINGGLLRTFPQKHYRRSDDYDDKTWEGTVECGSHNGNLQVGWLLAKEEKDRRSGGSGDSSDDNDDREQRMMSMTTTHPVFLDSWFDHINPYTGVAEPHCILYIVYKSPTSSDDGDDGTRIEYITVPWSIDAVEGNMAEFLHHRARLESNSSKKDDDPTSSLSSSLFLQLEYAQQFHLLEDRDAWMMRGEEPPAGSVVEDYVPVRGTLVVFDSVTLPHEVTAVVEGRRAALAGWFHEETQPLGGNAQW